MDLKVHHQKHGEASFSTSASISIGTYTRICICRSEFPLSHSHSVVMHIFCSIAWLSGQAFGMRILKNIITQAKCSFPLE